MVLCCLINQIKAQEDSDSHVNDPDKHQLVVFAISGLTSKSSTAPYMPLTHKMASKGLFTLHMRSVNTILKSDKSSWISIFYAATPSLYGCDDNGCDDLPRMFDDMPTWLDIMEDSYGYSISVFSQDKKMFSDVLDRDVHGFPYLSTEMYDHILNFRLPNTPRNIIVIHFDGLERLGEVSGFESFNYRAAIECIDEQIGRLSSMLWENQPEHTTFMLISNHGGKFFDHNVLTYDNIQVPFMMWGDGIKSGISLSEQSLQTIQIGATILDVLNMEDAMPDFWIEKPIHGIKLQEGHQPPITFDTLPQEIKDLDTLDQKQCAIPFSIKHDSIENAVFIISFINVGCLIFFGILFSIHF